MKKILLSICFLAISVFSFSQVKLNGKFDDITELGTSIVVPFTMPDGVHLMTDIAVPVVRDCLVILFDLGALDTTMRELRVPLEVIQRNKQIIIYDSLNGQINPNPYQLPMIWMRSPYGKNQDGIKLGGPFGMFGYCFGSQDMRGCNTSEGVYLPIYTDSWNKNPYHPLFGHILDITPLTDKHNANKIEDGYNSVKFITDSLKRIYDYNNDGIPDTFLVCNGRIGTLGASALGYNQYQAAAAHKIDVTKPGLKCMVPIVGPMEFYKSTGYGNGVLREGLVSGWLQGQIFKEMDDGEGDTIRDRDSTIAAMQGLEVAMQNDVHTSFDYGLPNKFVAAKTAIDHFCSERYVDAFGTRGPAGAYPSCIGRKDMDASRAMVDANGEGSLSGQFSRYTNMEVPAYNITGWWDIFIDGQIESWRYMRKYLSRSLPNYKTQKIIIGPWAHQSISHTATGDMQYPANVRDYVSTDFDNFDVADVQLAWSYEVGSNELVSL